MKFLLIPDSFKGTLSASRACAAMESAIRTALERAEDEHGIHAAGAGNADDLNLRGVIQSVIACQVCTGVRAPVAAEGNDFRFIFGHLHIASTSAIICLLAKPLRSIAPDGQATVQQPQP